MRLGPKLRKLIELRGTTQAELARAIGTYPTRLSEWVAEKGAPSVKQALLIARELDVTLDYLADDELDDPRGASMSDRERQVWEVVKAIGADEAWRRLVGAGDQRPFYQQGKAGTPEAQGGQRGAG